MCECSQDYLAKASIQARWCVGCQRLHYQLSLLSRSAELPGGWRHDVRYAAEVSPDNVLFMEVLEQLVWDLYHEVRRAEEDLRWPDVEGRLFDPRPS